MDKVNKKSTIHERPRERTADEHAEHKPFNLDFMLLTDLRWIHVGEDACARFGGNASLSLSVL
jgi:hypothetical protein